MNFKVFLLIFYLLIFLSKYSSIFNNIYDISVITDILFLGCNNGSIVAITALHHQPISILLVFAPFAWSLLHKCKI